MSQFWQAIILMLLFMWIVVPVTGSALASIIYRQKLQFMKELTKLRGSLTTSRDEIIQ